MQEQALLRALGKDPFAPLCKGRGCSQCFRSGYKGRQGIYEFVDVTTTLRSEIALGRPYHILRGVAEREGYCPLLEHGVELALAGETTLSEVLRVAKRSE
ncbi:general secretion pathway protein E [Chlamydia trachomatis]|nr:general secretion pathway protein E [Chlamydia trachomatis]